MTDLTFSSVDQPVDIDDSRWPEIAQPPHGVRARVSGAVARKLFANAAKQLAVRVELPDGTVWGANATVDNASTPRMIVRRPDEFFARVGRGGLIGFGEAYMAGDWSAPNPAELLAVFATRMAELIPRGLQRFRQLYVRKQPRTERNTKSHTRSNISRHYDLSNDLFAQFLDEGMSYSSALFDDPATATWDQLREAQHAKINRLLDEAGVGPGSRVLEIGTGWGELCIIAARRGATVTSVTLSAEQKALAEQRIADEGFADAVTIELKDYRDVTGTYDAVVSVEMIEAVGHQYWATYFQLIDSVLAPGGRVAIQAITMPHSRMLVTKSTYTWVHKYIFPGGFLPSVRALDDVTRESTTLRITNRLAMGDSYATTLRLWDQQFARNWNAVSQLGFDEIFRRMWQFYLCYSEAGFRSGYLDVWQLTLTRQEQ